MRTFLLALSAFALIGLQPTTSVEGADHQYTIARRIHVPGDSWWDYLAVEPSTGRLFVSHGTMVQVVDLRTGKLTGTIPNTPGVHGIALAGDIGKGYISDGADSSVTVFDLKTLKVQSVVRVTGQNPDAILYDSYTHRVFTFNGRTSNSTVLDAATDRVLGTILLSGKPEFAVSDGSGRVYVNIEDRNTIDVIDPNTMTLTESWPLAPGEGPSGLAIDTRGHRLFSVCHNKQMVVLDTRTGHVVASLPIGGRVDGAAYDPALERAYSSNGEGSLTIVQEEEAGRFKIVEDFPTQSGARTIAVDTVSHHLYLPTADFLPESQGPAGGPRRRPALKPGSFVVLDVAPTR